KAAARAQEGDVAGLGLALDHGEGDVAAEQRAALAGETVAKARSDGADTGDRHHAERDAGDEDIEAAQAAAQFAQRITKCERRGARLIGGFVGKRSQALCPSIRPERRRTTRSQRCASEESCVTSTSVMPRSACFENSRSTICFPVVSSRLPV